MRLAHSFASEKCDDKMFYIHMCYFILSCLYAKNSGFELALHCDNKTKDFLEMAPYDEIITDIEGCEWPGKRLYAFGKFIAMKDEPLGTIHIDGDVFLKNPELKNILEFSNYDCIVQNIEWPIEPWGYLWNESADCFKNCEYPSWAKPLCNEMYNCGVIGINNKELKDLYFDTYNWMAQQYKEKGIDCHSVPDLIIEQQFLKDLTDHFGYSVKQVLDFEDLSSANKIGYQHVLGGAKEPNVHKVLKLIKKYNLEIYNKLTDEKSYGLFYNKYLKNG